MNYLRSFLVAVVLIGTVPIPAVGQVIEWHGSGTITAFTSQCTSGGWMAPQMLLGIHYAPPGLGSNGPPTRLTVSAGLFNHYNFMLPSGTLDGPLFQTVNAEHIGLAASSFTAQVRVTSHTPATITATTDHVTLVGQISNWDAIAGCVANFDIVLLNPPTT
jgi:hypothetical protein